MSATSLLTLPFLVLVSIPLVITASITIFISVLALFLQLSVISFELCYALVTNLFTIPPSSNWSLLSFSVSGPTTPDRRRSSDYGLRHTPLAFRGQGQGQSQSRSGRPNLGPRMGSSNALLDSQDTLPNMNQDIPSYLEHRHRNGLSSHHRNSSGFFGLISGDVDRDFEGLGGWRCPPSYTKSPGYRSGRATPSSSKSNSVGDEIDDIAWLSMNSRLELPSQPLPLMPRHSNSASSHNLVHAAYGDTSVLPEPQPHLPWRSRSRKNSLAGIPSIVSAAPAADPKRSKSKGQKRHHRRSATTSALSLLPPAGSGAAPTSPSQFRQSQSQSSHHGQTLSQMTMQSRADALRSRSHTSLSDHWIPNAGFGFGSGSMASFASSAPGAGSYFALQPLSANAGGGHGAQTTSNTTPNEERKPARAARKAQTHQVPSLGSR
ncbi:uncharacterized protein DSM5745_00875 [Aspergillus mulundensis]|uniref:Uncharacterized protein n=1 Tax=Aspergillus mulundensis TaxID=1810919 RepID=A0A3D8T4R3_9EURO|nr:Uncharacterized protein DSM5745_00875 [Aspergillus mulundensis]RDW93553.1 Uncharacterized protein DSM5745_00875 [Aspergillus mulundensis]